MMKKVFRLGLLCGSLAVFCAAARAQAQPPEKEKAHERDSSDRFSDAVDLSRFRKGNTEWDTQELIASGLTALHEEQVRMLRRLDRIEARLERLDRARGSSSERSDQSGR